MRLSEHQQAAALVSQALPYMRRYAGSTIVVKFGGAAMETEALAEIFARDVVLLKQVGINPVVVHGGGPQIGRMLERMAIETRFVQGLRVTDAPTMDVVEMVLSGRINKQIALAITRAGGRAVGLSGKDAGLMLVEPVDPALGFVGTPVRIEAAFLQDLAKQDIIPVIAPIGIDGSGQTYNVNADVAAGAIAAALRARRLMLLTDVPGVLDRDGRLIPELSTEEVTSLRAAGVITGGMIPKVETCVEAVRAGVSAAVILDGREPHALLLEMFIETGLGTLFR